MRIIKTLALAAVLAAGTSAFGLAEEAAPDSIANHEPVFGTWFDVAAATAPQTVTTAGATPGSGFAVDRRTVRANRNAEDEISSAAPRRKTRVPVPALTEKRRT